MYSTPSSPEPTIRFTALLPPPPTPTTLMRAAEHLLSSRRRRKGSSPLRSSASRLLCTCAISPAPFFRISEELPKEAAQPSRYSAKRARTDRRATQIPDKVAVRVQHQADASRK